MRTLTSGAITVLTGAQVPIVLLVEMMFATPLRVASSAVPIVWNGFTWLGAGPLGRVRQPLALARRALGPALKRPAACPRHGARRGSALDLCRRSAGRGLASGRILRATGWRPAHARAVGRSASP